MAEPDAAHAHAFRPPAGGHAWLGAGHVSAPASVGAAEPPIRHVLFLNSYNHGYEWSDDPRVKAVVITASVGLAAKVRDVLDGSWPRSHGVWRW